ncbi:MAG TPA: hypothetical protein VM674_06575 [Candidatus Acidoferrum sp.]|nr:hypothetical protein [Candidatus Acidoferrum sp.]
MRAGLPVRAIAYLSAISLVAVVAALLLARSYGSTASLPAFLIITVIGALAHANPVRGFRHQAYQVTLPFIVLAAAMFNAIQLVAFIFVIHLAEQVRLRRPLYIQWFNACDYLVSAAVAAMFFHRATAALVDGALGQLIAALAAACAFILINRLLLAGILWLARQLSPLASGLFQPELLAADLIIAWISGPMLVVALQAGVWTILVTAGPLLLARPALSALLRRQGTVAGQVQLPAAQGG